MKLKTKQLVIRILATILALISLASIYLFVSGTVEYKGVQMEGVPTISFEAQIVLLSGLTVINILNLVFCQNLIKYKKILIVLNIIQLLFGGVFHIVSSIVMLVLLFIQTTDVQETEKKQLQLPELEKITVKRKWLYCIIWILLFAIFYTEIIPMPFLQYVPIIVRVILIYGIQAIILILFLKEDIKRDFLAFKNNFKTYLKYIFPKLGIFLIIYIAINIPVILIAGQISTNQAQINELPIALTAIMAVILAPILEEFMFRGLLRKGLNNDTAFMIFSSLVFGVAHVLYAEENLIMYIYIIPYALLGYFLARTYTKTNNIFTNITVHFMWNSLSMILMLATKLMNG